MRSSSSKLGKKSGPNFEQLFSKKGGGACKSFRFGVPDGI